MSEEQELLDLDALAPKSAKVKLGDQVINVMPPRTEDLLRLGVLSKQMDEAEKLTDEELKQRTDNLTNLIYKMVPELAGKPLGLQQIQGLINMFAEMAIPPELKELKKRGITPATTSKTP